MVMLKRVLLVLLVTVIALPASASASSVPAAGELAQQEGSTVTYDQPVEGAITNEAPAQSWAFTAQSADRLRVRVERLDGNLIPDVRLLNSAREELSLSYGADRTRAVASLDDYTLPEPGTYTIIVSRDRGPDGLTTGTYRLVVIPLGASPDAAANTTIVGALTFGTPVNGTVTSLHWQHRFSLEGAKGDVIRVVAQRVSGTLYPKIRLLDSNNSELQSGWPNSSYDAALLDNFELPYTGAYQVVLERDRGISGDTLGDFSMVATLLGSAIDAPRLADIEPGVIDQYDAPFSGAITNEAWYQDWNIRTEARDTITIVVERDPAYSAEMPNNLIPKIYILDADGVEQRRAQALSDGATAVLDRYTIPTAGLYTVRVTRDLDKTGTTTGTYTLTVYLNGSGEGSPFLQGGGGTIAAGTPVQGSLTNARWMETWSFSGEQGQTFNFIITRTSGTLVPMLELRDSNGVTQRTGWATVTADAAAIDAFTLPYTGNYQIVAMRDGAQEGATTGDYELIIQPVQ